LIVRIHQALRPWKNGAAADLLPLHDAKAAAAVHGRIGNGGLALLTRPPDLGIGRSG